MLRSTRLLLLLAIVLILGAVGASYYRQRAALSRQAPPPPKALPLDTASTASSWVYNKYDGQRLVAELRAKNFRQLNEPDRLDLEDVEMRLIKPDGKRYDRIRSARAQLDKDHDNLYSDGQVDMTLGVPLDGPPHGRLLNIHGSGVSFNVKTGRATTERQANFTFDLGDGQAVGAVYDPDLRELIMNSQVELHWRGSGPPVKPMKLEAGELIYREREAVVLLNNWARLTRENNELNAAGGAIVNLQEGMIRRVLAKQATGSGHYPTREVQYSADEVLMEFNPDGDVEKVTAGPHAHLISTSDIARTTVDCDTATLEFAIVDGESTLSRALTNGHSSMESVPVPRPGVTTPESRRLHSDVILLTMRPGGREIAGFETHAPGHLEFLPNSPGQRHRTLDAERMSAVYGADNQIQTFSAHRAATHTDPEARPASDQNPPDQPVLTWSDDLSATFDPKTSQLARLEQWGNFRYQEGDRHAHAHRAVLEQAQNVMNLDQAARVWDSTGSTSAGHILLDQKSGDVQAEGDVVSTRMPDQNGKSSSMLSHDEPMNATAAHMRMTEHNQKVHYDGQAVAWQGANRIWADNLDIDRTQRQLAAHGHVRTQFVDQKKKDAPAKDKNASTFATVESAALLYTEADRLAHYTGGAHLVRATMDVKASEIRAFLNDSSADSSLDHAFADGRVVILRIEPTRTLTATSEHAEYYSTDQRMILSGGQPTVVDSTRSTTKGKLLTYWANDDKLLVNGAKKEPVSTRLQKRESHGHE
jgi:lipopolysaccharide export system protein LptA